MKIKNENEQRNISSKENREIIATCVLRIILGIILPIFLWTSIEPNATFSPALIYGSSIICIIFGVFIIIGAIIKQFDFTDPKEFKKSKQMKILEVISYASLAIALFLLPAILIFR